MIDPVKLADLHEDISGTFANQDNAYRDTATALRLLSDYAEAAGAEVEAWKKHGFVESAGDGYEAVENAEARTDAARAALVAAGIRVGGGE